MGVFLKAREGFLGGDIDWNTNKLKAILVDMNDAPAASPGSWVISNVTYSGTTVTVTLPAGHGITSTQTVEVFGVNGVTNVNGIWTVTGVTATTIVFTVTTTPTGTYTSGGWVANLSLTFLSEFVGTGGRVATSPTLTSPTIVNGVADVDNTTFTAVPGPDPVEAILIVQAALTTGAGDAADTAQRLIWLNTPATSGTSGLPVTPNGGDIVVTWNAQGLFAI
jgi:hypothetical protein